MKGIKNIIFMLLMLLNACFKMNAQPPMDLQQCLIYADEHAPANDREKAQYLIYRQDRTEAWASFLPSMGMNVSAEYNFGRSLDPGTNTYQDNKYFNNYYSASAELPLFNGLIRVNQVRLATAMEKMGKEQVQVVRDRISLRVINAFYNVVYYRHLVVQMEGKLAESELNLYQSIRMEELGLKAGADVAQMEANVASDQFSLIRQQNLLMNARVELKAAMNYPIADSLSIDETLGELLPRETMENPDSLFLAAKGYLPQALAARHQLEGTRMSYRKSLGNFFPTLSLYVGYNTNYFEALRSDAVTESYKNQMKHNAGQYVGMRLSIPIFNRLTRISERRRARFRLEMQQATYTETLSEIQQAVTEAVADLNGAAREYIQAIRKVNAAELAHRVNRRKFEQGMISALDLQNSANQLSQAKAEQVGMHVQYLIRSKQVDFYQGVPFIEQKSSNTNQ